MFVCLYDSPANVWPMEARRYEIIYGAVISLTKISCYVQITFLLLFCFYLRSAALGRVCMKLVVVMGITWVLDVASWAHNVWTSDANAMKNSNVHSITHDIRYYFWYVMDAINALQGVLIFLVVASQPQVSESILLVDLKPNYKHIPFYVLNEGHVGNYKTFRSEK